MTDADAHVRRRRAETTPVRDADADMTRRLRIRAVIAAIAMLAACGSKHDGGKEGSAAAAAPAAQRASLAVRIDRRVELISLLARLGKHPGFADAPATAYTAELDKVFARYADHPAVAATAALDLPADALLDLALHLDDPERGEYAAKVKAFAQDVGWEGFFDRHGASFARVTDTLRTVVEAEGAEAWFGAWLGPLEGGAYTVVVGLAAGPHAYLVRRGRDVVRVVGVRRPDGMAGADDETLALVSRGLAQAYVERRVTQVPPSAEQVFAAVGRRVAPFGIRAADRLVVESAASALYTLYLRAKRPDAATLHARAELRRGLLWHNDLVELFRRARAPGAGFPELAPFFDGLARDYAAGLPRTPFLGAVEAVTAADHVAVAPSGDEATAAYVRTRFPGAATASDHTLADAPHTGLVAFGAPGDNLVVAGALAHARISVHPDAIVLGKRRFPGTDLVLVFAWFRRDDPTRGVAVYTAQRNADLVGIAEQLPLTGRDWYVARRTRDGFTLVDRGDFPRAVDGAWTLP
ncbi:MAG: hypothetical protein KIT31_30085 [Deltaproteobacteria bacterium]|nr:hypothetical protein [Deltaproteobacteria bacterium]